MRSLREVAQNRQRRVRCGRQCRTVDDRVPRLEGLLIPSVAGVAVLSVDVDVESVNVTLQSSAASYSCPGCGGLSTRVHSWYPRFAVDGPVGGMRVRLSLRVRRFVCVSSSCGRRTFVEQIHRRCPGSSRGRRPGR
ncbi:transposase family protein [Kitasatospora sp. NPDC127111]|uniref:transposase family protein n=1 Tax=Kitasatospora sp. NPDC127111 TaxID=3345363 RepID=UPI00362C13CE